jgi:hypothetical protein
MAMVASNSMMNYEDVRKQRMEEKKQKMEALGGGGVGLGDRCGWEGSLW